MTIIRAEAEATIFSRSSAPPPPLIRLRSGADLVGTVDRQIELRRFVEAGERHAQPLGVASRRFRGRHRNDVETGTHAFGQELDEMPRGRAGAEPEPHAGADEFERACRGRTFLGFNLHGREYLSAFRGRG